MKKRLPQIEEAAAFECESEVHWSEMMNERGGSGGVGGIGSCSGVEESIVRSFFVDDKQRKQRERDPEEEDEEQKPQFKGCGAAPMLNMLLTCWKPTTSSVPVAFGSASSASSSSSSSSPSYYHGRKAWEKRKAAALLELNKQQQAALADKQDAIDMLEWQLEQLQLASAAMGSAAQEDEMAALERCIGGSNVEPAAMPASEGVAPVPPAIAAALECSEDAALALLFEMAVIRARLSIRHFCSLVLKQMEASGYAVCRALAAMEPRATFLRKEHTVYVLDARVNKAFFACFESESFDGSGITKILDPAKRCAARLRDYRRLKCVDVADAVDSKSPWFDPAFLRFCQAKTSEMWNELGLSVAFRSIAERDAFTAAFLDVAKACWLLHGLAFATQPAVSIIRIGRGSDMNPTYVEPVAQLPGCCDKCTRPRVVEFMVMPGFRTNRKVIKCQVYPHVQCK